MLYIYDMEITTLHWLAGLLEGEGSFIEQTDKYPARIALQMTDKDVIDRVGKLFNVSVSRSHSEKFKQNGWKPTYAVHLRGSRAIEWMKLLQPLMGDRRKEKIDRVINSFYLRPKGILTNKDVDEIINLKIAGMSVKDIAKRYPVTKWRIYQLVRGFS